MQPRVKNLELVTHKKKYAQDISLSSFTQQRSRHARTAEICVAGNSVRLHISLPTWCSDLATMETLLAGDWHQASTHTEALQSYADTLQSQT